MPKEEAREKVSHVYHGWDRKLVEVLLDDGTWAGGELRSWDRNTAGAWSAMVNWSRGPGHGTWIHRFPAERVRPAPVEDADA